MSDLKKLNSLADDMVKVVDGSGLKGEQRAGLDSAITSLRHEAVRASEGVEDDDEDDGDSGSGAAKKVAKPGAR